jgi:uncharacterized protein YacL
MSTLKSDEKVNTNAFYFFFYLIKKIKMKNSLLISINVGLLLSYIFTYYCHSQIKAYTEDLSEELKTKYETIRKERMSHFGIGLLLAVIIGALLLYYNYLSTSTLQRNNIIILLILLLPMIVYKILPKSDYMLNYTQTDQDYKDWFDIYSCMKSKSMYGFLVGFTISMILLNTLVDVD